MNVRVPVPSFHSHYLLLSPHFSDLTTDSHLLLNLDECIHSRRNENGQTMEKPCIQNADIVQRLSFSRQLDQKNVDKFNTVSTSMKD